MKTKDTNQSSELLSSVLDHTSNWNKHWLHHQEKPCRYSGLSVPSWFLYTIKCRVLVTLYTFWKKMHFYSFRCWLQRQILRYLPFCTYGYRRTFWCLCKTCKFIKNCPWTVLFSKEDLGLFLDLTDLATGSLINVLVYLQVQFNAWLKHSAHTSFWVVQKSFIHGFQLTVFTVLQENWNTRI